MVPRSEKKAHLHCCILPKTFERAGSMPAPFKNYVKESESPQSIQDFVNNEKKRDTWFESFLVLNVYFLSFQSSGTDGAFLKALFVPSNWTL
jgi:hypothetical protein